MNPLTSQTQQAMAMAREEAERSKVGCVGAEHLLLGLMRLDQSAASKILKGAGLDFETIRNEMEKPSIRSREPRWPIYHLEVDCLQFEIKEVSGGNFPYTLRAKKALAFADEEAKSLNHSHIGTPHVLLGLLRDEGGPAIDTLRRLGVDIERMRDAVLAKLDPKPGGEGDKTSRA